MKDAAQDNNLPAGIRQILERTPGAMTAQIGRQLGVSELEVLRNWPIEGHASNLDAERIPQLIEELDLLGRVHVIASNEGCVLEAYGHFGGFSTTGPFLNVQTATLDMHIRYQALTAAVALIKPSHQDGQRTYSFQFFTASGTAAFKVFLYKSVSEHDAGDVETAIAVWEDLRRRYAITA